MNMDWSQTVTRVWVRIQMRIQMRALRGLLRTQAWMTMVMACFSYTKYYLNILGQLFWGDYSEL